MLQLVRVRDGSPILITTGSVLPPVLGIDGQGWRRAFPPSIPPQDRCVMGTALPCSQAWGWLTHTCDYRVGFIVLPKLGTAPAFPNVAAVGVRDSSPALMTTDQLCHLPQALVDRGRGQPFLPLPSHNR